MDSSTRRTNCKEAGDKDGRLTVPWHGPAAAGPHDRDAAHRIAQKSVLLGRLLLLQRAGTCWLWPVWLLQQSRLPRDLALAFWHVFGCSASGNPDANSRLVFPVAGSFDCPRVTAWPFWRPSSSSSILVAERIFEGCAVQSKSTVSRQSRRRGSLKKSRAQVLSVSLGNQMVS